MGSREKAARGSAATEERRVLTGISAPSHPAFLPNNMFREFFGVLKDVVCRNM